MLHQLSTSCRFLGYLWAFLNLTFEKKNSGFYFETITGCIKSHDRPDLDFESDMSVLLGPTKAKTNTSAGVFHSESLHKCTKVTNTSDRSGEGNLQDGPVRQLDLNEELPVQAEPGSGGSGGSGEGVGRGAEGSQLPLRLYNF